MKTGKRILTILLTLCVVFTMMPLADIAGMTAYAADGKGVEREYLNVPAKFDKEIDISKVTGDIVIKDSKTYRIYSSEKKTVNHKIKIQKPTLKNIEPHVFIDGISIDMDAGSKCPAIEINNKASAYLYFYGGNSDLRGADYRAAIQKTAARTICIFWSQAARACIATEVCTQQASAVRQTATRTGITLICMDTA